MMIGRGSFDVLIDWKDHVAHVPSTILAQSFRRRGVEPFVRFSEDYQVSHNVKAAPPVVPDLCAHDRLSLGLRPFHQSLVLRLSDCSQKNDERRWRKEIPCFLY